VWSGNRGERIFAIFCRWPVGHNEAHVRSVDFARLLLQEHVFPSAQSLFDHGRLADSHILELG
jgi:hypothetical protein